MIRNYKNYNIQQRKDGRYTVTVTEHGHSLGSLHLPQAALPSLPASFATLSR